jgi:hypothetical protein
MFVFPVQTKTINEKSHNNRRKLPLNFLRGLVKVKNAPIKFYRTGPPCAGHRHATQRKTSQSILFIVGVALGQVAWAGLVSEKACSQTQQNAGRETFDFYSVLK